MLFGRFLSKIKNRHDFGFNNNQMPITVRLWRAACKVLLGNIRYYNRD